MNIKNRQIGPGEPCFIIAEGGVNHNGDINLAKKIIDAAVEIGADAIKFQTWITEEIVTKYSEKAEYQKENWGGDSFYDEIKKLELPLEAFKELFAYAQSKGIICLSTPDDVTSLNYLIDECDMSAIKVGSGVVTDHKVLKAINNAAAKKHIPVFLSTGMSDMEEVKYAVNLLSDVRKQNNLVLLHCVSNYPAAIEDVNLLAMKTLESEFNVPIGYSDHTLDIVTPIAAVALGGCVHEKHFTIDKNLPGPDHQASLNPVEFKEAIDNIRKTEILLGQGDKKPVENELEVKRVIRRSIVAKSKLLAGSILR
ncbi:N-acetylneuraminate synthase family protein, partial [Bacteroidota bacterium]